MDLKMMASLFTFFIMENKLFTTDITVVKWVCCVRDFCFFTSNYKKRQSCVQNTTSSPYNVIKLRCAAIQQLLNIVPATYLHSRWFVPLNYCVGNSM